MLFLSNLNDEHMNVPVKFNYNVNLKWNENAKICCKLKSLSKIYFSMAQIGLIIIFD